MSLPPLSTSRFGILLGLDSLSPTRRQQFDLLPNYRRAQTIRLILLRATPDQALSQTLFDHRLAPDEYPDDS